MGIVNVTPDSFSDGGEWLEPQRAVEHALRLVEDGAGVLDIGGESTRPGSRPVPAEEQIRRVLPVVAGIAAATEIPISIDTTSAAVAREAIAAGAVIVNDISGLTFDVNMQELCAETGVGVVCMHIQGTPATMQDNPRYDNDDVVGEVKRFLAAQLARLEQAGVPRERVLLDPGIGFGKTAEHNLRLLASIGQLRSLGCGVLVGHSRKRFLSRLVGRPVEERLAGTVGVAIALAEQQVDVIRVHDVRAVRDALVAWRAVRTGETETDCG